MWSRRLGSIGSGGGYSGSGAAQPFLPATPAILTSAANLQAAGCTWAARKWRRRIEDPAPQWLLSQWVTCSRAGKQKRRGNLEEEWRRRTPSHAAPQSAECEARHPDGQA